MCRSGSQSGHPDHQVHRPELFLATCESRQKGPVGLQTAGHEEDGGCCGRPQPAKVDECVKIQKSRTKTGYSQRQIGQITRREEPAF